MVATRQGKDTAKSTPDDTPGVAARTSAPIPATNTNEKDHTAVVASASRDKNQQTHVDPTITNTPDDTMLWHTVTKGKHAASPKEQPKSPADPKPTNPHTNTLEDRNAPNQLIPTLPPVSIYSQPTDNTPDSIQHAILHEDWVMVGDDLCQLIRLEPPQANQQLVLTRRLDGSTAVVPTAQVTYLKQGNCVLYHPGTTVQDHLRVTWD